MFFHGNDTALHHHHLLISPHDPCHVLHLDVAPGSVEAEVEHDTVSGDDDGGTTDLVLHQRGVPDDSLVEPMGYLDEVTWVYHSTLLAAA